MTKTDEPHKCFTVDNTAYLHNLSNEDLREPCIAIHYQKPPVIKETGTTIGLRFPMLILAHYLEDQRAVAEKVARILEEHWDKEDQS